MLDALTADGKGRKALTEPPVDDGGRVELAAVEADFAVRIIVDAASCSQSVAPEMVAAAALVVLFAKRRSDIVALGAVAARRRAVLGTYMRWPVPPHGEGSSTRRPGVRARLEVVGRLRDDVRASAVARADDGDRDDHGAES